MTQLTFSNLEVTYQPLFHDIKPHIVVAFIKYMKDNPTVYEEFKQYAYVLRSAGVKHFGGKAIAERIRFESAVRGNDGFKLNNSYVACMVRWLQFQDPAFKEFFEVRGHQEGE